MPQLPDFTTIPDLAAPSTPPASGALVPEAIQRGAAAVGATADQFAQGAIDQQRSTEYANHITALLPKLQDLQFQQSQVPDHVAAHDGFLSGAAGLIDNDVAGISDPYVKARVETDLKQKAAFMAADVQQNAFGLERDSQRATLDASSVSLGQQLAAAGSNPDLAASITATFQRQVNTALDSHLIAPTEAQAFNQKFISSGVAVGVEQQRNQLEANRDPMGMLALATKVNDPSSFPGLLPETREYLGQKLENLAHTYLQTAAVQGARADAAAERALRINQEKTAAQGLAFIYNGGTISTGRVLDMAKSGQLSTAGVEALHAAAIQGQEGHDDPTTLFHLYDQLGTGVDISPQVGQALTGGQLSTKSAVAVMDANRAMQDKTYPTAAAKAGYDQLMTAIGADKVKAGLFTDPNTPLLVSAAQGEYFDRVNVQHQDPASVLSDMLPRYIKTAPTTGALPLPRFGPAPASVGDIGTLWSTTKAALAAGTINQATYEQEGQLLQKYQAIIQDQATRRAALQGVAKPAAPGVTVQPGDAP